ncbi:hypothetical protein BH762_gp029 [Gordonia phage OneUp]|uniref:Uncharacterized protein n=1 Tax=Gordonia phage OneUp TaxID=1838074 RepID=A0A160DF29_9CAUD|nr:hypothetical protein BH762_gp029 [Gordonia phage OneUp]ANA86489.1 hypothetical protein PBI_ONEUP_156 [Gordonia phage OneUp]
MAEIVKYVLVDSDDNEGDHYYDSLVEARQIARLTDQAVVAHTFEFSDSELVWTPNGDTTWPPTTN